MVGAPFPGGRGIALSGAALTRTVRTGLALRSSFPLPPGGAARPPSRSPLPGSRFRLGSIGEKPFRLRPDDRDILSQVLLDGLEAVDVILTGKADGASRPAGPGGPPDA